MVQLQILNKVLADKDYSIIEKNALDESYFDAYPGEYTFIKDHYDKYKNVPDTATFLDKFPEFDLIEVNESTKYLVDKIREEHLYQISAPILQKAAELYGTGSTQAVEYLIGHIEKIRPNYGIGGVDIIQSANDRYKAYKKKLQNHNDFYFSTGFNELDEILYGIQRGEEFFVIFARVNQGKSWILEKMCTSVWAQGYNVGYISPEMSAESVGYRFDTLYRNYSNAILSRGQKMGDDTEYKEYLEKLTKNKNKLVVSTPLDFNKKITISKLRNWVKQNNFDLIAIDGITYLTDERYKKGDSKTNYLTNISEDLMSLSVELKIPILAVVQANRGGVSEDDTGTPELESIRDSDGISFNASKVVSIRQKFGVLELGIKKNRNGRVGDTLKYIWDIDTGEFTYVPGENDNISKETLNKQIKENKERYKDSGSVF